MSLSPLLPFAPARFRGVAASFVEAGGGKSGWATLHEEGTDEGTVHVHFGPNGYIDKGPRALVGQHLGKVASHPSVKRVEHHKPGVEPKGARDHPTFTERAPGDAKASVGDKGTAGESGAEKAPQSAQKRAIHAKVGPSEASQAAARDEVGAALAQARGEAKAKVDADEAPKASEKAAERTHIMDDGSSRTERQYQVSRAIGTDAGNRSMKAAGRTSWNEDDYNAAARAMNGGLDKGVDVKRSPAKADAPKEAPKAAEKPQDAPKATGGALEGAQETEKPKSPVERAANTARHAAVVRDEWRTDLGADGSMFHTPDSAQETHRQNLRDVLAQHQQSYESVKRVAEKHPDDAKLQERLGEQQRAYEATRAFAETYRAVPSVSKAPQKPQDAPKVAAKTDGPTAKAPTWDELPARATSKADSSLDASSLEAAHRLVAYHAYGNHADRSPAELRLIASNLEGQHNPAYQAAGRAVGGVLLKPSHPKHVLDEAARQLRQIADDRTPRRADTATSAKAAGSSIAPEKPQDAPKAGARGAGEEDKRPLAAGNAAWLQKQIESLQERKHEAKTTSERRHIANQIVNLQHQRPRPDAPATPTKASETPQDAPKAEAGSDAARADADVSAIHEKHRQAVLAENPDVRAFLAHADAHNAALPKGQFQDRIDTQAHEQWVGHEAKARLTPEQRQSAHITDRMAVRFPKPTTPTSFGKTDMSSPASTLASTPTTPPAIKPYASQTKGQGAVERDHGRMVKDAQGTHYRIDHPDDIAAHQKNAAAGREFREKNPNAPKQLMEQAASYDPATHHVMQSFDKKGNPDRMFHIDRNDPKLAQTTPVEGKAVPLTIRKHQEYEDALTAAGDDPDARAKATVRMWQHYEPLPTVARGIEKVDKPDLVQEGRRNNAAQIAKLGERYPQMADPNHPVHEDIQRAARTFGQRNALIGRQQALGELRNKIEDQGIKVGAHQKEHPLHDEHEAALSQIQARIDHYKGRSEALKGTAEREATLVPEIVKKHLTPEQRKDHDESVKRRARYSAPTSMAAR